MLLVAPLLRPVPHQGVPASGEVIAPLIASRPAGQPVLPPATWAVVFADLVSVVGELIDHQPLKGQCLLN